MFPPVWLLSAIFADVMVNSLQEDLKGLLNAFFEGVEILDGEIWTESRVRGDDSSSAMKRN